MLRNLAYSTVSSGTAALLLVLMIVAGRVLGDVEFGKFAFALLLGGIFETAMDFGLHQVTIRAVARDPTRASSLLRHTLAIKLLWAAGTLTALVVTATILRPEWDVRMACYLIGGSLVFRSYMLTIRGVLQGLEQFGWDSIVVIADRGLLLVLGVAALWAGTGLRGLTLAFVVARGLALALAAVVTQFRLGGVGLEYDGAVWRELHATALPLGFFLVVLNLYSYVDGVMLGVMRTDAETGLYTAAYKIYEGFTYAPMAISTVLTPRLSALFTSNPSRHRAVALNGVGASFGLALVVGVIGYALATPILVLLFGADFAAATPAFRILCAGLPIVFVIWILHAIAISVDRERLLLKTGLIGLAVNVGLNLFVIPRYGGSGAAFATVAGELVSAGVLVSGLRKSWSSPPAP
ncbi:MAG TPA: flippase [Vicinamibacterales bacterium]|jgi:O-antigen/teichoic acid export membrane protein